MRQPDGLFGDAARAGSPLRAALSDGLLPGIEALRGVSLENEAPAPSPPPQRPTTSAPPGSAGPCARQRVLSSSRSLLQAPDELTCCITLALMTDPVVALDGEKLLCAPHAPTPRA